MRAEREKLSPDRSQQATLSGEPFRLHEVIMAATPEFLGRGHDPSITFWVGGMRLGGTGNYRMPMGGDPKEMCASASLAM